METVPSPCTAVQTGLVYTVAEESWIQGESEKRPHLMGFWLGENLTRNKAVAACQVSRAITISMGAEYEGKNVELFLQMKQDLLGLSLCSEIYSTCLVKTHSPSILFLLFYLFIYSTKQLIYLISSSSPMCQHFSKHFVYQYK